MRVLHLLCSTGWGGAERIACTLLRLQRAHGLECFVDGPHLPEVVHGVQEETNDILPSGRPSGTGWRWAHEARNRRRLLHPDLVHVHLATPGLASVAWYIVGDTPTVVTFHLLPQAQRWSQDYLLPLPSERVLKLFDRYQSAHRLVTVSQADQQRLVQRLPETQVRVIQNVPPLAPLHAKSGAPLEYPAKALRLLSVGRLEAQKGFERLMQTLGDRRLQALDWHWNIVGEGSERPKLEALVHSLGLASRVTLAGARPAHDLFAQADLVLCPSRFEGMPLVPLEAQLAGVPVLVSDIAAHRELFGKVKECFLPFDETAWADRLCELLASRDTVRSLASLLQAEPLEDPRQRFLLEYSSSYDDVLGRSPA